MTNLQSLSLNWLGPGIRYIQEGAFEHLANLRILNLNKQWDIEEFPRDLFKGLTELETILVGGKEKIRIRLEPRDSSSFVLRIIEGAPFDTNVVLSTNVGTLSNTEVTVGGGHTESEAITLTPDVAGTVRVVSASFTEDANFEPNAWIFEVGANQFTLAGSSTNNIATGQPVISGTPQVGQTLEASVSEIVDTDGTNDAEFSYQWIRDFRYPANTAEQLTNAAEHIQGATGLAHTLTGADFDRAIMVQVTFTDDGGTKEALYSEPTAMVRFASQTPPNPGNDPDPGSDPDPGNDPEGPVCIATAAITGCAPGAVENLEAEPGRTEEIVVHWDAPYANGGHENHRLQGRMARIGKLGHLGRVLYIPFATYDT